MRAPAAVLAVLLAACGRPVLPSPGTPGEGSLAEVAPVVSRTPVDLERLQRHLDRAGERAARLAKGQSAPRGIAFDAAGGAGQQEHARLGHGVLVLVVAVSHDPAELPLRRVRALGPGSAERELVQVGRLPPPVLAALRLPPALGSAADGGLWFLPEARATPGPLLADFARSREGLAFGEVSPAVLAGLHDRDPARPEAAVVRVVAAREFPVAELLPDLEARLGAASSR